MVEDIGGGSPRGVALKAAQIGGPSGGCVPTALFDTPIDYEALVETGAIMGSGGLVVMDQRTCMVDVARYFLDFTQRESCGKCSIGRIGTRRLLEALERLCSGQGNAADLERLETLSEEVRKGSLCGLCGSAPNPILTTLRHFREEYEAHLQARCPGGGCRGLITFGIDPYNCEGCERCFEQCPVTAIAKDGLLIALTLDAGTCIRCGGCEAVCPFGAIEVS